jgi:hypothetical protein
MKLVFFKKKKEKRNGMDGKGERERKPKKLRNQREQKRTEDPTSNRAKSQKQYFAAITTADRVTSGQGSSREKRCMTGVPRRGCPPPPPDHVRQLPQPSDRAGPRRTLRHAAAALTPPPPPLPLVPAAGPDLCP